MWMDTRGARSAVPKAAARWLGQCGLLGNDAGEVAELHVELGLRVDQDALHLCRGGSRDAGSEMRGPVFHLLIRH